MTRGPLLSNRPQTEPEPSNLTHGKWIDFGLLDQPPCRKLPSSTNPFRASRIEQLSFRPISWSDLLRSLKSLNFRAAIIGPEGTGKTTLLLELATRLECDLDISCHYLRAEPDQAWGSWRAFCSLFKALFLPPTTAILLDDMGVNQRSFSWRFCWMLSRVLFRNRRLIVTAHAPCYLPAVHHTSANASLLEQLVTELAPALVEQSPQLIRSAYAAGGGNIRTSLLLLYDWCAGPSQCQPAYHTSMPRAARASSAPVPHSLAQSSALVGEKDR